MDAHTISMPPVRVTRTYVTATAVFLALALLDTLVPGTYVTGNWWLVLLLLWLMPWPARRFEVTRPIELSGDTLLQLVTLTVMSWIYYRANTALLEAATYWDILKLDDRMKALDQTVPVAAVAIATAFLLAAPLQRAFHRNAIAAAFLVATPWLVLTCGDTAFDFVSWRDRPVANAGCLFQGGFPALFLMQACSLLERRRVRLALPVPTVDRSTLERLGPHIERCPRWVATSIVQPAIAIAMAGIGVRLYYDAFVDLGPAASSALVAIVPLSAVLLTAATVHHVRRRVARTGESRTLRHLFQRRDTLFAVVMLSVLWSWALFVDAPLAEFYAKDALAAVPGPAWSIDYVPEARALRVSGEYSFGVAAAFAEALERHPHVATIELSGPGGRQSEGLGIAHLIESHELATVVTKHCASACTLAFVAGRERTLLDEAGLGFHAVSAPVASFNLNRTYDHYLAHRGVGAEFIRRAAEVPPSEMWYPERETLAAAGVLTRAVTASAAAPR
jgi:hypothetical protein